MKVAPVNGKPTHDVMACGIIHAIEDTDTYQRVIVATCVHGKSVLARQGSSWTPASRPKSSLCSFCHLPVLYSRAHEVAGQLTHRQCAQQAHTWSQEQLAMFVADWNRGVLAATLRERYGMTKHGIDGLVARLRRAGTPMTPRTRNSGWYQRASRRPSPRTRQTHALATASAFKRNQFGARA